MQSLLFFSRVAFICNLCFVFSWFFETRPFAEIGHVLSTVLVLGYGVAALLNVILNLIIIAGLLMRKPLWSYIPRWLVIVNFLFLVPQTIFFLT